MSTILLQQEARPVEVLYDLPSLRMARVRVRFRAKEQVLLSGTPANVWRGLVGAFLHRLSPPKASSGGKSLYELLFSTPQEAVSLPTSISPRTLGRLGLRGDHVPHPFVLRVRPAALPSLRLDPGETLTLEMTLVEEALGFLPALCAAFESFGDQGIGRHIQQRDGRIRRGRMVLEQVVLQIDQVRLMLFEGGTWSMPAAFGASLYEHAALLSSARPDARQKPMPASLTVHALTPMRLRQHGKAIDGEGFDPFILAMALYRRLLGLAVCYGKSVLPEADLSAAYEAARTLAEGTRIDENNLQWVNGMRYRKKGRGNLSVSGIAGSFTLKAPPSYLRVWQHLLTRVEPLHVGKSSSLGQGWLALAPVGSQKH